MRRAILGAAMLAAAFSASAQGTGWYTPTQENKPYVRWWWLGSAVDKEGLTYNLEEFASKGIGGVEVTPIYGVQDNEANDISYLSPEWMEMYKFLKSEGERLGVQIDLNCGTGWPFGGPQISDELAAHRMKVEGGTLKCVQTRQKVKRAAPGGEGWVMDHYNPEALKTYLERFDKAFAESGADWPDTWFNDSYEVYGADWTQAFPEIFRERYGYDIVEKLVAGPGSADYDRAVCDYRECLGALLYENFTKPWTDWAHSHGARTRNQAHGSPANIIDLYAAVDIPECETYGGSEFDIPGLRKDSVRRRNDGDPSALKFATSAAHLTGKKTTSAEALTWMTDHFRTSLSQCKPELDLAFASGVNHIYFHGAPYSPKGVKWPGWMFYAAINMSPTGSMWGDADGLFKYIERCQAFLTAGEPDADVLLYLPIYDAWSNFTDKPYMMFAIHDMQRLLPDFKSTVQKITEMGFEVDYISDKLLQTVDITKPVIVPNCRLMPVETAKRLAELKAKGVKVYFIDGCPDDVPGLHDLAARRREFKKAARSFGKPVSIGKAFAGCTPETFKSDHGITMLRRRNECGGHNYFVAMLQNRTMDGWVKLARPAAAAMIYDPLTGTSGKAELRKAADGCAEVRLQLEPGDSRFIKTFSEEIDAPGWRYIASKGEAIPVDKAWSIRFVKSDPAIDGRFFTDKPCDWTTLKPAAAKHNWGTAKYSTAIQLDDPKAADEWILDLGEVRESARVVINGEEAGVLWSAPFKMAIGSRLKPGINMLDVYVTNLPSNRIAQMDRDGEKWRIFKDANIAPLPQYEGEKDYTKRPTDPSGLCGEVTLTPVHFDLPMAEVVLEQVRRVNDYFMRKYPDPADVVPFPSRHKSYGSDIWTRGVYYEGLLALNAVDPQQRYLDYTRAWGECNRWNMRNGDTLTRNADNYCCAQGYFEMYDIFHEPEMIANAVRCMENILATPEAVADWTWIDAIQMGMPAIIKMGNHSGDKAYYEKAWQMYSWARERFYNGQDGLWWRDKDFCPPFKTPGGRQCYWSRGNGWVFAALARVLDILPADEPHRDAYIADFKAMAAALADCARSDGTWNCSLADPDDFGGPEATGTSLFVYGLAFGVRTGLLDAEKYLPAVSKGWNALQRICIHEDGFIGYSQGSGKEPKEAQPLSYDRIPDFEDFGTGCYLLAGSEVYKLAK